MNPPAGEKKRLRRTVQLVFQNPYGSLNPRKKVGAILEEPLVINTDLPKAERTARARAMMAKVGLRPEYYARYPHMFSGGQRQRIAIARALMLSPKLLVADEPVSALDVSIQAQVLNLLADLQQELGLAYLFISHDLGVVEQIADRVVVMYRGRILECGTRDQVYDSPRHPYTLRLLAATPRISRTADEGYELVRHAGAEVAPPAGFAYYAGAGAPVMHEVSPGHTVALQAA